MSAKAALNVMDASDYRKLLKQKPSGAFLFCGSEEFMKQYCIGETRKYITDDKSLAAFNIMRFSGIDSLFTSGISNAMSTPPMFCERHMVELSDIDLNSAKEEVLDELIFLAQSCDEDTVFIVNCADDELTVGDISKNRPSKAFAKLAAAFKAVVFEPEPPSKLASWISKHFLASGVAADARLCYALMERSGHSMTALSHEIDKLTSYVLANGRKVLTDEDIAEVACQNAEFGEFAFSNAILERNRSAAYAILDVMKANREKPELILASVTGIFSNMNNVKVLSDCGLSSAEIASRLGVNEYRVTLWQRASKNTDAKTLDRLIHICLDADLDMKTSAADKFVVIDRMLALAL